jgi:hypothetical protein
MAEIKPKLRVDVNKNPTKAGIKVQFVLPQTIEGDKKAELTQKLQTKLNQGLGQYNLTISQDTDTPYANVIGFLIPIADVKLLIKKALGMGEEGQAEPTPEEAPAPEATPEEPMKEMKRMQELAGLKEGRTYWHVLEDSGYGNIGHQGVYDTKEEAQAEANRLSNMFSNSFFYIEASNSEAEPYSVTV